MKNTKEIFKKVIAKHPGVAGNEAALEMVAKEVLLAAVKLLMERDPDINNYSCRVVLQHFDT
jgi:hypothetical protein